MLSREGHAGNRGLFDFRGRPRPGGRSSSISIRLRIGTREAEQCLRWAAAKPVAVPERNEEIVQSETEPLRPL